MQKISLIALALVLVACSAPAQVIPTAPVTLTVPPTSIPTSIPTLTETATPIPTETATPEVVTTQIASMAEFDQAWYSELGKVIEVADLYGAGAATITIEAGKLPDEGQVLEYQNMIHRSGNSSTIKGVRIDRMSLENLTIEGMHLVKVDLADNSYASDGYWLVLQLGTIFNGNQLSFAANHTGNSYQNQYPKRLFEIWQVGDVINNMLLSFTNTSLSKDVKDTLVNVEGMNSEQIAESMFFKLGALSEGTNWTAILAKMKAGGILGPIDVAVTKIE